MRLTQISLKSSSFLSEGDADSDVLNCFFLDFFKDQHRYTFTFSFTIRSPWIGGVYTIYYLTHMTGTRTSRCLLVI